MSDLIARIASRPILLAALATLVLIVAAVIAFLSGAFEPKGPLAAIKSSGKLTFGVRSNAPPFSSVDPSGASGSPSQMMGFEPDIAKALAAELGVRAEFVAVEPDNAASYLTRGIVDVVLAPRLEPGEEPSLVAVIDPGYFASGLNVIARTNAPPPSWESLNGSPVCGLEAGQAARQLIEELGGRFLGFTDPETAMGALIAERCAAFVGDEVMITAYTAPESAGLVKMPFETLDVSPWFVVVRSSDADLRAFIEDRLIDWHREGFLIDRARTWNLPENPFLALMRDNYLGLPMNPHPEP